MDSNLYSPEPDDKQDFTRAWQTGGDIIREMGPLFERFGFSWTDEEIGGFGSVHLFCAERKT